MKNKNLKEYILENVQLSNIYLKGDNNHIHIIAIGDIFIGMKNIQKQQIIYKPLTKYIIKKKIHAVTIDTFTNQEWEKKRKYFL